MIISLLLSFLATTAFAQSLPAQCVGKSGAALTLCVQQSELDALKADLAELHQVCEAGCSDAPAPAAPTRSSGPSRTSLAITALEARVAELESLTAGGVVSDRVLGVEIKVLQDQIDDLNTAIQDLESRPAAVAPPPVSYEPLPGPAGRDGADGSPGRDGFDGKPAEITAIGGVTGLHSPEWNLVGAELTFRVGGRPSKKLVLGGYASGLALGANDLGYGVGGFVAADAASWFSPGLSVGWSEIGLDIESDGARRVIQGVEGTVNLQFRPVRPWAVEFDLGVHSSAEGSAFVWGVAAGTRF